MPGGLKMMASQDEKLQECFGKGAKICDFCGMVVYDDKAWRAHEVSALHVQKLILASKEQEKQIMKAGLNPAENKTPEFVSKWEKLYPEDVIQENEGNVLAECTLEQREYVASAQNSPSLEIHEKQINMLRCAEGKKFDIELGAGVCGICHNAKIIDHKLWADHLVQRNHTWNCIAAIAHMGVDAFITDFGKYTISPDVTLKAVLDRRLELFLSWERPFQYLDLETAIVYVRFLSRFGYYTNYYCMICRNEFYQLSNFVTHCISKKHALACLSKLKFLGKEAFLEDYGLVPGPNPRHIEGVQDVMMLPASVLPGKQKFEPEAMMSLKEMSAIAKLHHSQMEEARKMFLEAQKEAEEAGKDAADAEAAAKEKMEQWLKERAESVAPSTSESSGDQAQFTKQQFMAVATKDQSYLTGMTSERPRATEEHKRARIEEDAKSVADWERSVDLSMVLVELITELHSASTEDEAIKIPASLRTASTFKAHAAWVHRTTKSRKLPKAVNPKKRLAPNYCRAAALIDNLDKKRRKKEVESAAEKAAEKSAEAEAQEAKRKEVQAMMKAQLNEQQEIIKAKIALQQSILAAQMDLKKAKQSSVAPSSSASSAAVPSTAALSGQVSGYSTAAQGQMPSTQISSEYSAAVPSTTALSGQVSQQGVHAAGQMPSTQISSGYSAAVPSTTALSGQVSQQGVHAAGQVGQMAPNQMQVRARGMMHQMAGVGQNQLTGVAVGMPRPPIMNPAALPQKMTAVRPPSAQNAAGKFRPWSTDINDLRPNSAGLFTLSLKLNPSVSQEEVVNAIQTTVPIHLVHNSGSVCESDACEQLYVPDLGDVCYLRFADKNQAIQAFQQYGHKFRLVVPYEKFGAPQPSVSIAGQPNIPAAPVASRVMNQQAFPNTYQPAIPQQPARAKESRFEALPERKPVINLESLPERKPVMVIDYQHTRTSQFEKAADSNKASTSSEYGFEPPSQEELAIRDTVAGPSRGHTVTSHSNDARDTDYRNTDPYRRADPYSLAQRDRDQRARWNADERRFDDHNYRDKDYRDLEDGSRQRSRERSRERSRSYDRDDRDERYESHRRIRERDPFTSRDEDRYHEHQVDVERDRSTSPSSPLAEMMASMPGELRVQMEALCTMLGSADAEKLMEIAMVARDLGPEALQLITSEDVSELLTSLHRIITLYEDPDCDMESLTQELAELMMSPLLVDEKVQELLQAIGITDRMKAISEKIMASRQQNMAVFENEESSEESSEEEDYPAFSGAPAPRRGGHGAQAARNWQQYFPTNPKKNNKKRGGVRHKRGGNRGGRGGRGGGGRGGRGKNRPYRK